MTRVFGSAPAVVRATVSIERGECVLVRGANGAGKSTLLRVIATVLSPTYGSGTVLGHDLVTGREEIRPRIEFLGHRTRLYDDLTGRENLAFVCSMYGIDPSGLDGAIDRVGLSGSADDRVRHYSHGMRQRLAVARALVRRPDVLLLDEPYAGLDDEAKALVDWMIEEARRDGRTVMLATHDVSRGAAADRVLFMEAGRILPDFAFSSSQETHQRITP
ncbi:MAG TPA: ABC transporter ATP-binding protein [Actinomycetota bacterium]